MIVLLSFSRSLTVMNAILVTDALQDDIMTAEPAIEKKVEHHVKNHRWMPAGYKVRLAFCCFLREFLPSGIQHIKP